ncbi:MAG: tRNA (guanosine(37)-N1)-methyltransferase TrmD [Oscillospiraceae bacterium]|nr:tRNA (guanosine(37)-N1)-methyltransferase TrmD [Oscillospiraceae bacterium]
MRVDVATLFPDVCEAYLSASIIGRARKAGAIQVACHNIRDYTDDKHRRVDDKPYGGGTGMVMQAEPIYRCINEVTLREFKGKPPKLIYMSPQGKTLTQGLVKTLAKEPWLFMLCGHYEGVDNRVLEELPFTEISVGDYVVTGGELPALMLIDAVARLQEGVLPNAEAYSRDSHWQSGVLEHPLYTRPEAWRNRGVPTVLLSGHHENIEKWRESESLNTTYSKRPDLM